MYYELRIVGIFPYLSAEECLDARKNGISGEAEFLVEHLVGSGRSEVVETEHLAVSTYHATECGGETGCETEGGHTGGEDCLTILEGLLVEESDGGD